MTLDGNSFEDSNKEFKLTMVVAIPDESVKNTEFSFSVKTLFKNDPPSFGAPLNQQTVTVGKLATWYLPKASDPDGDEFTVKVELDKLPWLTSDSKSFTFSGDKAKAESAGQYKVPIKLEDKYGASVTV